MALLYLVPELEDVPDLDAAAELRALPRTSGRDLRRMTTRRSA